MKVLFIGLGQMGRRMAKRLDAADTMVWNRTPAVVEQFQDAGYAATNSLEAGAGQAAMIITMLTDQTAVQEVLDRGLLQGLRPGTVWVDMTTGAPDAAEEFSRVAARRRARFLAAPVLGSLGPAEDGTLTVLAGGSHADLDRVEPVLARFGTVRWVGSPRQALVMKLLVNTVLAYYMQAVSECLPVADAEGISRADAIDILLHSSVAAPVMEAKARRWRDRDYADAEFPIRLLAKDLDLMAEVTKEHSLEHLGIAALQARFAAVLGMDKLSEWDMAGVGEAVLRGGGEATRGL